MSSEKDDAVIEAARRQLAGGFQGEEDIESGSTPQKDLVASVVVAVFAAAAFVLAWQMPDPGRTIFTHPGVLPFFTGLTLFAMAIGLAVRAVREGGANNLRSVIQKPANPEEREYARRSWILISLVIALIVAIDIVSFRIRIPIGDFEFKLSSFECVSIPIVTVIFKLFWGRSWWRCLLVSVIAAMVLAAAFRWGFKIPMPGVD